MNLLLMLIISGLVSAGVYLVLSKDLLRIILGLVILGTAANLVVFFAGYPLSSVAGIIETGSNALPPGAANPLPQALVLTAIVIGFALLCFALLLMVSVLRQTQHRTTDALTSSEASQVLDNLNAAGQDRNKPPVLEAE